MQNATGPNTEPWGTPKASSRNSLSTPLIDTNCLTHAMISKDTPGRIGGQRNDASAKLKSYTGHSVEVFGDTYLEVKYSSKLRKQRCHLQT